MLHNTSLYPNPRALCNPIFQRPRARPSSVPETREILAVRHNVPDEILLGLLVPHHSMIIRKGYYMTHPRYKEAYGIKI
jgi:hypothetical protein